MPLTRTHTSCAERFMLPVGVLQSMKYKHREEAAALVSIMGLMQSSLLTMEDRIGQRIDGIEAAVNGADDKALAAERAEQERAEQEAAAIAAAENMDPVQKRYQGFLGREHQEITASQLSYADGDMLV
jgi:hypothetical protein